jgi:hypothetical protein
MCQQDSAMICGNTNCSHCSRLHSECLPNVKIEAISKLIEKRAYNQEHFLAELFKKEEEMVNHLRASRESIVAKCRFGFLDR